MDIKAPSKEEIDALLSDKAYRYPAKAFIDVPGDGGKTVRLPLVLGNPSGACKLPPDVRAQPAWQTAVAATLKVRPESDDIASQLAQDCILWPDLVTWNKWANRWPAIPMQVMKAVRLKYAGVLDLISSPQDSSVPPDAIAQSLSTRPHSAWKRLSPKGKLIDVVIDPPQAGAWKMFVDAIQKKDSDVWGLSLELARASVPTCEPIPFSSVIDEWPGTVLLVVSCIGDLIGAASEVELGEW